MPQSTSAVFSKTRFKAVPLNEPGNIMEASLLRFKDAYQKTAATEFINILVETDAVKRRLGYAVLKDKKRQEYCICISKPTSYKNIKQKTERVFQLSPF